MGLVYPAVWLPHSGRGPYRHMAKRDATVWEGFLKLYPDRFDAFAYDCALGGVITTSDDTTEADRLGWQYSTALKIDAVAKEGDRYFILEVRPEATVSALGAALSYVLVADREEAFPGPLASGVVCNSMQPDVLWCCQKLGVEVFFVPTA
jgi:hypothetical protein